MDAETILAAWVQQAPTQWTDLELRLMRRVPVWAEKMATGVTDPIDRALAGLASPPEIHGSLRDQVRISLARMDQGIGNDASRMEELESQAAASGDAHLWLTAARLHVLASPEREATARMALSDQTLPYVFPGEIDERMVHVLSAGERVLPALHVDWIRKVTTWLAPVLHLDCKHGGLWFWPVLRSLDEGKLLRPLQKLAHARLPPAGLGLAAAYCRRLGADDSALLEAGGEPAKRVAALATAGDASKRSQMNAGT